MFYLVSASRGAGEGYFFFFYELTFDSPVVSLGGATRHCEAGEQNRIQVHYFYFFPLLLVGQIHYVSY